MISINPEMKDLTIVIPTYDRYIDVYRHIKYLNKYFKGISVIIVDGTPKDKKKILNTSYFSDILIENLYIEIGINERIKIGVSKVKTKFTCLIGDDDRLDKKGVDMCINFLENNDEFIASYGKTYAWSFKEECFQMYNYSYGPRPFDKISRVIRAMHFYTPQLYCSIWRTSAFNKVVHIAAGSNWSSGQVFELLLILAGNLYGNHFCFDTPYWERAIENDTITEGTNRSLPIISWMKKHDDELSIAKKVLVDYFRQDADLIELAFHEYEFFEKYRKSLVSSGAMEAKYRAINDNTFPESKILPKGA